MKSPLFEKKVFAWALYDWANSAFATTVMVVFFPLFFKQYLTAGQTATAQHFLAGDGQRHLQLRARRHGAVARRAGGQGSGARAHAADLHCDRRRADCVAGFRRHVRLADRGTAVRHCIGRLLGRADLLRLDADPRRAAGAHRFGFGVRLCARLPGRCAAAGREHRDVRQAGAVRAGEPRGGDPRFVPDGRGVVGAVCRFRCCGNERSRQRVRRSGWGEPRARALQSCCARSARCANSAR